MNPSPFCVTIGPPRFGVPYLMGSGTGARSRTVPRGTSHFTSPVSVSTASSVPQGGLLQGRSRGGKEPGSAVQTVGRALHLANRGAVRHVRLSRFQRLSRDEAGDRRQAAHVKDHPTPLRLKCDAPPIRSADHAWVLDRPSRSRRCEDAIVAMALDLVPALAPVPGAQPPSVIATERGWRQWLRLRGERLCGPASLAGHIRLWYQPFFHRENRFTGFEVEEKEKAHLGGLRDGWDVPTILPNGD